MKVINKTEIQDASSDIVLEKIEELRKMFPEMTDADAKKKWEEYQDRRRDVTEILEEMDIPYDLYMHLDQILYLLYQQKEFVETLPEITQWYHMAGNLMKEVNDKIDDETRKLLN